MKSLIGISISTTGAPFFEFSTHKYLTTYHTLWGRPTEADLRKANLRKADLSRAKLRHTDLRGAILDGADLSKADLYDASLQDAMLVGANLTQANLGNTDFRSAIMEKAKLNGADLRNAILVGANLRYADLSLAKLDRTDMREADIAFADLTNATCIEAAPDLRDIYANLKTILPAWMKYEVIEDEAEHIERQSNNQVEGRLAETLQHVQRLQETKDYIDRILQNADKQKEAEREKQEERVQEQKALFEELNALTHPDEIGGKLQQNWTAFLNIVRAKCGIKTQAALRSIRDMNIWGDDDSITVGFAFGTNTFAKEMIAAPDASAAVSGLLSEMLGRPVKLVCVMGDRVVSGDETKIDL